MVWLLDRGGGRWRQAAARKRLARHACATANPTLQHLRFTLQHLAASMELPEDLLAAVFDKLSLKER